MEYLKIENNDLELDWSKILNNNDNEKEIRVETVGDGLINSLRNLGKVDIEYISKITKVNKKEIIYKLRGLIFQNPNLFKECYYMGYETSDEYLSGNILRKLKEAIKANQIYNGLFDDNIKALKDHMPKGIEPNEIFFSLVSPWIPKEIIIEFIANLFNQSFIKRFIYYDKILNLWNIDIPSFIIPFSVQLTYGTPKISVKNLLEHILNHKKIIIYDYFKIDNINKKKINNEETLLAKEKAKLIEEKFKNFIYSNLEYLNLITSSYNERFGYNVTRIYNGSFLTLPGLSKSFKPFDYQKNAIARIIFSRNTLLAHNVGSGKTYVMIIAGEELIRCGISKKNLYVVPNNIVGQWREIYNYLYPNNKALFTNPSDFTCAKRRDTLELIKSNSFNAVVVPFSSFDKIPLSNFVEIKNIQNRISEIDKNEHMSEAINNLKKKLNEQLEKLLNEPMLDDDISFDKLGFERIFIDEAHNYKNIPIETKMAYSSGINKKGSIKCKHMLEITDYMNGKGYGVIMATGTPITNSISDIYTIQRYLQPGELKLIDIPNFDAWVSMFAECYEEMEIDVDANHYRTNTRFSKFHNLPELTMLLSQVADFYYDEKKVTPKFLGYTDIKIKKYDNLINYLNELSLRIESIRSNIKNKNDDNMLKITNDGRMASLDLRLIDSKIYPDEKSKVYYCSINVLNIYRETMNIKGTQIVFCDISTPKCSFNIYDDLKMKLINLGIPENQVAYIHDAVSDKQRNKLFEDVRNGSIRVIIGSTIKLGTGVNIQKRLYAIHHLDVPWRPADMMQREGRIIRQGNLNKEVKIFRYIQENSFDAYSWQLLEIKQNFINELLANSLNERTKEDIEDTSLSYAEVKAIAIGNPYLKEYAELKNKLNKLVIIEKRERDKILNFQSELNLIPKNCNELKGKIKNLELDVNIYNENKSKYTDEFRRNLRKKIWFSLMDNLRKDIDINIDNYQGFTIIAPAHLIENNLHIKIKGMGEYDCRIGNNESRILFMIDNVLKGLEKKIREKKQELSQLYIKEKALREQINERIDYSTEIEEIKNKLDELGRKINING